MSGIVAGVIAVLPAEATEATEAVAPSSSTLPSYVPADVHGPFDVGTGMFNLTADNTVRTRAAIAAAATAPMTEVFVGDSITAGWNALTPTLSGTIDRDKAWPMVYQRALNARLGLDQPGTGLVRAFELNGLSQPYFDARWSPGPTGVGVQARGQYLMVNNSTVTFDSGKSGFTPGIGTAVAVVYLDSENFTVSVDGGTPRPVTGYGTGAVKRVEITGLAATTHVVRIQVASDQHVQVVGAEVFSGRGFSASNVAQGGSGVTGGLQDDWSVAGPPSTSLSGLFGDPAAYSRTPSTVFITLGGNDLKSNEGNLGAIRDGILETANQYADADIVLIAEPHGSSAFTTVDNRPLIGMLYELAAQQDWPLWDLEWLTGGFEAMAVRGMNGDTYGHMTVSGYAWIGNLLAETMFRSLSDGRVSAAGPATVPGQSLSTPSLAFGAWPIGDTSPPVAVSVRNTSNGRVQLAPAYGSTEYRGAPSRAGDCAQDVDGSVRYLVLDVGESCFVRPVYAPSKAGAASAVLAVTQHPTSELPGRLTGLAAGPALGSSTLGLSGSSSVPKFTLAPTSLAFGNVGLYGAKSLTTVVKNASSIPLQFDVEEVTPFATPRVGGSSDQCLVAAGSASVPAGGSCTLRVEFRPTSAGAAKASLVVRAHRATGDGPGPVVNNAVASATLPVTGTGVAPTYSVSTATAAFGNVTVGVAKTVPVTVTNTSAVTMGFAPSTPSGSPYRSIDAGSGATGPCTSGGLPVPVPAGGKCVLSPQFTPTATGSSPSTLTVAIVQKVGGSFAPVGTKAISLTGTGIAPTFTASPTAPAFGNVVVGSAKVLAVTLKNTSQASLTFTPSYPDPLSYRSAPATAATDPGSCVPSTGPALVAPGASCTVRLQFTPQSAGAKSATITVAVRQLVGQSLAQVGTLQVKPTGSGVLPTYTLSPTSLSFGTVAVGTSKALGTTVKNTSTVPLLFEPALTGGVFSLLAGAATDCANQAGAVVVPAGGSCSIRVAFAPTSTGAKKASVNLEVAALDPGGAELAVGTKAIPLSGTGG